uniref:LO5 n=1 Tax=Bueycito anole adomavirus TaxID=2609873 RepID=A0A6F9F7S0_9VIRU|nr:TPA_asm: LO5 [Bueycito anole adomavirus]
MDRKHWEDYLVLKPGEAGRPLYMNFEQLGGTLATAVLPGQGFTASVHEHGRSDIGISLLQFSCVNAPCNICDKHDNNLLFYNGSPLILREGYYGSVSTLIEEMRVQQEDITFEFDHLGIATYTGTQPLLLPVEVNHNPMPDSLPLKLGYTTKKRNPHGSTEMIHPNKKDTYLSFIQILPGEQGNTPGDIFGPISDICVTCNQAANTPESGTIISIIPISAMPSRSYVCHVPPQIIRPLQYQPKYNRIELALTDRVGRPLHLSTGVPSALLRVSHL